MSKLSQLPRSTSSSRRASPRWWSSGTAVSKEVPVESPVRQQSLGSGKKRAPLLYTLVYSQDRTRCPPTGIVVDRFWMNHVLSAVVWGSDSTLHVSPSSLRSLCFCARSSATYWIGIIEETSEPLTKYCCGTQWIPDACTRSLLWLTTRSDLHTVVWSQRQ